MVDLVEYICWTPKCCRWNKEQPPQFTIWLNILYACAGGFTAANLYYSHPILNLLSQDFDVTEAKVSSIPALAVAGDTTGLLFILPLADYFPRRRFTLTLVSLSAAFWLGLCLTTNFNIFLVLTYLSALFTGVCQIMLPLVSELSTPESRAFNLSIVGVGPTLAILLARILSGIVANYTAWRNIYWLALGLQISVLILLWLLMPDYPPINKTRPRDVAKTYPKIIRSILVLYTEYPILVQTALLAFCTFFTVSSYWTTLSFLLSGSPYHYSTMVIGLFGLIGAATMVVGPIYAKYIIQPLKEPLYSVAIGKTISLTGIVVGTFVGTHHVAGPVIQALFLDAGLMIVTIASRMSLHPVAPLSRNRVNTAYTAMLYLGQFIGTKAGTEMYASHGGWLASGGLSIGIIVLSYTVILLRGPNETGWIGWRGGWHARHEDEAESTDEESVQPIDEKASKAEGPKTEEG